MVLLTICIAPVLSLFALGPLLGAGCRTESSVDGEAGRVMIWRIETVHCKGGPAVTNVLVAPRGKTLALAASATGAPRPRAVSRGEDGTTKVELDGAASDGATSRALTLKATGRPALPLVLIDGRPKR